MLQFGGRTLALKNLVLVSIIDNKGQLFILRALIYTQLGLGFDVFDFFFIFLYKILFGLKYRFLGPPVRPFV